MKNKIMDKTKQSRNPGDSGKTETLETITIRVAPNVASNTFAVKINPWEKRVLVNAGKLEFKDGRFTVKAATPIRETNIKMNDLC